MKDQAQHKTGIGTRQDKAQDMTDDRAQLKTKEGRHKRRSDYAQPGFFFFLDEK